MLNAKAILAEAEQIVGISDTDSGVADNLQRLLAAIVSDFPVSEAGEQRIHRGLLRDSIARLEGLRWLRDYPEIAEEPIIAPVFLMGLPRSGTTYFQYLFDRDPRFRLIRTWESITPSPPPGFDPESAQARKAQWAQMRAPTFEGFDALHLIDADGSDECHAFLEQSFGAAGLNNLYRVPDYFDHILDGLDLVETYRIHKRQLQLLQWKSAPKPWALKYPNHVIALDAILEVYPDARFVMTHRDPVQVLASIAKMSANLRGLCEAEAVDRQQVGRDMLHFIQRHIDRIMAFDVGPHGSRVVHVDYYALIDDPVREMRAIHRGIGIDTPAEVAETVGRWHAANPKNARGRNDYALAHYGLDEAAVAEQFGDYIRRFAIPREQDGLARIGAKA
ncbi:sulfotransferase [Sphingobium sufflavum]|uniref:sulfotransferase family protein n=1 Tax=Sphingobium sufflavum TaxID=1129547 RepID=UPI001F33FAC3|nr:sulfotransferase [Sphingobium sufflavum]MCE7796403.1 sulfotransferase [Sphingobium sufflavum]